MQLRMSLFSAKQCFRQALAKTACSKPIITFSYTGIALEQNVVSDSKDKLERVAYDARDIFHLCDTDTIFMHAKLSSSITFPFMP